MNASHPHQAVSDRIVRELGEARQTYVLVVAIDPVVPDGLAHADVLVVAPALNSWLRHWLSDEDPARGRAEKRLAALVEQLQRTAVHVEGRVGDADPLQAIADVLPTFPADEIVIAARPEHSTKLVDDLVWRARERFALPIVLVGESRPIAA